MVYEVLAERLVAASRLIEAASAEQAIEIAEDIEWDGGFDYSFADSRLGCLEVLGEGVPLVEHYRDDRPLYFVKPRLSNDVQRELVRERYRLASEVGDVVAASAYQAGFMLAMKYLGHDDGWVDDQNCQLSDLLDGYIDGEWE